MALAATGNLAPSSAAAAAANAASGYGGAGPIPSASPSPSPPLTGGGGMMGVATASAVPLPGGPALNAGAGAGTGSGMKHRICMVSDFFYPRLGGVENHIWSLSQCLIQMGHKVVVVTNTYGRRKGIRYMTNGLKVYYAPMMPFVDQDSLPTFCAFFPLFRKILLRERITLVHGHQATSTLNHEAIHIARTMGIKAVYTDHSLFGFADAASINLNKLMKFTLSDVSHAIAVSHTCRENLVLRASLAPERVSAIPNAVDPHKFIPDPKARRPDNTINVVMVNRLVYRKGIDLVVDVIPVIAERFPHVHFIIGGDGPKRLLLEEMREKHQLHERVELLGAVPHAQVRDVLVRGHIFLNCSLTESFCIAILEAASAGLYVVSTAVGGVPEVLPDTMIEFADPDPNSLIDSLARAIKTVRRVDPWAFHGAVQDMYSWYQVAERTQIVYDRVARQPDLSLMERFRRFQSTGVIFGLICCAIAAVQFLLWRLLDWWTPAHTVEVCPDFPYEHYGKFKDTLHQDEAGASSRGSGRRRRGSGRGSAAASHRSPSDSAGSTLAAGAGSSGGGARGSGSKEGSGGSSRSRGGGSGSSQSSRRGGGGSSGSSRAGGGDRSGLRHSR